MGPGDPHEIWQLLCGSGIEEECKEGAAREGAAERVRAGRVHHEPRHVHQRASDEIVPPLPAKFHAGPGTIGLFKVRL